MVVASNFGDPNALVISASSIVNTTKNIAPFSFATVTPAGGEGLTTSFVIYDSLGSEVEVRLRMVLEDKDELGTTWRFYAESADDSDLSNALGTGTISFDENGRFTGATGENLTVSREGTGAADLTFAVDYSAMTSLDNGSEAGLKDQDGLPFGTLVDFSIDEKGFINGAFSNANVEVLGQLENSGAPNITVAEEGGAGQIESGALELSNVDLAREFIGLINASTGFSASSRVITTADELLQELLLIVR
jgi:flagellar hook protein FlgE